MFIPLAEFQNQHAEHYEARRAPPRSFLRAHGAQPAHAAPAAPVASPCQRTVHANRDYKVLDDEERFSWTVLCQRVAVLLAYQ